ncbi:MAG TPA: hypothetical protein V6C95_22230, partial [Coleofasciculaceae cyanobacterium]
MTQMPPKKSFEQTQNEHFLSSNGFPSGGHNPAIDDSSSFPNRSSSPEFGVSVPTQNLPFKKQPLPWWHFPGLRLNSLRTKATLLALAIGTVPVGVVGTTAYFTASKGIEEQIIQSEKTNADDLEDKLNLFVKQRYDDILALSKLDGLTNPKVREALTKEEKNTILKDWLESSKVYNSIAVYDPKPEQGEMLASAGTEVDLQRLIQVDYSVAVMQTDRPVIVDPRSSQTNGNFS